jgi:hypothetical protein
LDSNTKICTIKRYIGYRDSNVEKKTMKAKHAQVNKTRIPQWYFNCPTIYGISGKTNRRGRGKFGQRY